MQMMRVAGNPRGVGLVQIHHGHVTTTQGGDTGVFESSL